MADSVVRPGVFAAVVPDVLDRERLDRVVRALRPQLSWSHVRRLIVGGRVKVGSEVATDADRRVIAGVCLSIEREAEPPRRRRAPEDALCVLYEDDRVIALDKPAGLPTSGTGQRQEPDLFSLARRRFGRFLMVHRLDRDTSGVLLAARDRRAHRELLDLFARGRVQKTYLAVVARAPDPTTGVIRSKLGRPEGGKRQSVEHGGRRAETSYRTIGEAPRGVLVELRPTSGRTHQLRIHMAEEGCPIAGDGLYGGEGSARLAPRVLLHALSLEVAVSWLSAPLRIGAPAPADFRVAARDIPAVRWEGGRHRRDSAARRRSSLPPSRA